MAFNLIKNSRSFLRRFTCSRLTKFDEYRKTSLSSVRGFHLSPCLEKIVSFKLSDIGEGIREVTIKEWFIKVGDTVEQFDNLCEVQSDKASVTITSRYDGKITKIHYKVDEIALVGKPLLDFEVEDEDETGASSSDDADSVKSDTSSSSSSDSDKETRSAPSEQSPTEEVSRVRVLTTPAVRRIAMENKIDLNKVPATGKLGRVLKGDLLEFLGHVAPGTNKPHPSLIQKEPTETSATLPVPEDKVEVLKGVRKAMLKTMTESLKIPHFAYCDEVDMTNLIEFRNQLNHGALEKGVTKLTFMPFCIKAASLGLLKYPILNSSLDVEKLNLHYKGYHNISVAIDTPRGLVVPNVKNCQEKSIIQIAKDLNDLIERGRAGTLRTEDFANGTFSLSNIGIIGGTYTHPCIMPPQVSIGAIGRTKAVPRFGANGEVIKAHIMNVSWCADHRVIDGVTMANFSNLWKKYLENPALFLLEKHS